ncbi:MAG: hypothetical protein APR62_12475 [Smithella sp. SDB]|nr:MAG: hypothetical protein APR62_12475 [Smithella sp. SDB]
MNKLLRNWLSQVESWEAAAEFGIPRDEWVKYDIIQRNEDVYIASLSAIFDALRIDDMEQKQSELWSLAKTLLVYSRGAAARYLSGVGRDLNQLYAATLFYIAGYPATATFLARNINDFSTEIAEEEFIHNFLSHDVSSVNSLTRQLALFVDGQTEDISDLMDNLSNSIATGIICDPRQFIAARLARECIQRFSNVNIWKLLREHAADYSTDAWKPFFATGGNAATMWELLPSQEMALTQGLMSRMETTFSLQMPTSAGKTALCELLIYQEVKIHGRFVLFLVPFRALAAEIQRDMSSRLHGLGIRILATHGGNIPTRSESSSVADAEVLIVTPEKFAALEQMIEGFSDRFQTIICDEGHLIDDESRGLGYELLLTRLRGVNVLGRRFIFLSAVLPNVSEINVWLGGDQQTFVQSEYRPVDTDYCFIKQVSSNSYCLDVNPTEAQPRSYYLYRFLTTDDFRYTNPVTGRLKLIDGRNNFSSLACAATLKARRNGPVALFTTTRGRQGIQSLGKTLLNMVQKGIRAAQERPSETPELKELFEYVLFLLGHEHLLAQLVRIGIGYHHGRLPQEIRRAIEEGVQEGSINIIICTNTLAEGVNLPIRTMVVHTVRRYDPDRDLHFFIPKRSIKNIIGRAGRAGKETRGRIIFVNWNERVRIEQVLREQEIEPAKGLLCRLIETLHEFSLNNKKELTNELFERQRPWFLEIIDKIDLALLNLIASDAQADTLDQHLNDLLEQTLARRLCTSEELQNCLEKVFQLRAEHLVATVEQAIWPKLRKSGSAPRFWRFVNEKLLLQHPLWLELQDPLDDQWLQEVIMPLLSYEGEDTSRDHGMLQDFIKGWMSGLTYQELAEACGCNVDRILDFVCNDVGYVLQDLVAKLCQLATETHDERDLSEPARNWSSLLQYGLGTLQQLDLFERGVSDRLAVWGATRYIEATQTTLRGRDLVVYLRRNGQFLRSSLERDERVPTMSVKRFIRELRIR